MIAKRAVVTGASSGIGRALALELAKQGSDLVLVARREPQLREVAKAIEALGRKADVVVLDVGDTTKTALTLRALDGASPIDLVIANAGVGAVRGVDNPASWEAMAPALHTNFCGAAATLTALVDAMASRKNGHLVGIGSLASLGALPDSAAYCAPKAGLAMLLECLRLDLEDKGIGVTHVRLGFVRTPMVEKSTHSMPQLMDVDVAAVQIVKKLDGMPAEIALPEPLALATRLFGAVPRALRDPMMRFLASRGTT